MLPLFIGYFSEEKKHKVKLFKNSQSLYIFIHYFLYLLQNFIDVSIQYIYWEINMAEYLLAKMLRNQVLDFDERISAKQYKRDQERQK